MLRSVEPQKRYHSQTQAAIRGTDPGISDFVRVYSRFMRLLNLLVQAKSSRPIAFGVLIGNYGGVHHQAGLTKINPRSGMKYAIVQITMRLNDKDCGVVHIKSRSLSVRYARINQSLHTFMEI